MQFMNYSSVRVKKIRAAVDARNLSRHGAREKGSFRQSAVDLKRTHLNRHWAFDFDGHHLAEVEQCPDYRDLLERVMKAQKAKRPKNGTFGTEMLFTASREFFLDAEGRVDQGKASAWAEACIEMAQEKYPGLCAAARLDMDETTPHLSIFVMPVYEKTYGGEKRQSKRKRAPRRAVSHNRVFGGRGDLSNLQDWAADGLQARGFELSRGIPVEITRAKNFRPDGQLMKRMEEADRKIRAREAAVAKREKQMDLFEGWLRQIAVALQPQMHLLPKNLLGPIRKITAHIEKERANAPSPTPAPALDDQIIDRDRASSSDPLPPEPDAPAPPAPLFRM
ncbi:MAG: plasmid recombination protein [Pseudomonadota bacterium]|nr:plasmid recombination protein [Pseudomonadota bacterium]